jgi:poly-gamma-glutamate capsule biosynthesis protein CapA/YwtB (metallophosphatase superfamily)
MGGGGFDPVTHILPGGSTTVTRTLDESVAMARSAVADGIRIVAATPHVREDYRPRKRPGWLFRTSSHGSRDAGWRAVVTHVAP